MPPCGGKTRPTPVRAALDAVVRRRPTGRQKSLRGQQVLQRPRAVGLEQLAEPADRTPAHDDLGEGHLAGQGHQLGAAVGVLREVDLAVVHAARLQQRLRLPAEAAGLGCVEEHDPVLVRHPHQSLFTPMPGSFKTEAIVLRSIRYGEADRVLHLYTADRGRVGAVAKGVRKVKSRLGGRLEPLSRVRLVMHQGRGELCTISQADTVHAHAGLREHRAALERGVQACEAVLRLLDSTEPNRPAYNLLCNELALLDESPDHASRAQALAFRLKLLLAAGFAPELASCAACGEGEHLGAFSPSAGGVVCAGCEAGSFPLAHDAHGFLVEALARPLAEAPDGAERALQQADRALAETMEYHAHVRLRRVA